MAAKVKIAGVGCALVDYLYTDVDFSSDQFKRYLSKKPGDGGWTPGKLVFTEELEQFAGTSFNDIVNQITNSTKPDAINIGGPGLVSLIHVAQLLHDQDVEVMFFGARGDDVIADSILDRLEMVPMNVENYVKIKETVTPYTVVLSDRNFRGGEGERTFINNIGAAWKYTPNIINQEFFKADIVCFGGTALTPNIHDNLDLLLRKVKNNGCLTIVNTVFDFQNEKKYPENKWPLGKHEISFPLIDMLIMDYEESLRISGENEINRAVEYFIKNNLNSFIITNGIEPVIFYSNGNLFKKEEASFFPVSREIMDELKTYPEKFGDTTGCGDNFAGGVIANIALQMKSSNAELNIKEALSWGVISGGLACFYIGGTFHEKVLGEKKALMSSYFSEYDDSFQ